MLFIWRGKSISFHESLGQEDFISVMVVFLHAAIKAIMIVIRGV